MYAAMLNKKLVLAVEEADQVLSRQKALNCEKYHCPQCRKRVILVISESKIAFFKHLAHYEGLGEKDEHHLSKMLLKSAFTAVGFDAQVEVQLAQGRLRSDVLVSNKLAIEVQCAPLSKQEFAHRHHLYQELGVFDLWIVGKRHYLGKKLKQTQLIFFRNNQHWGEYYLEVDPVKGHLRLKYNIVQAPAGRQLVYQVRTFSLDEQGVTDLWKFRPKLRSVKFDPHQQLLHLKKQISQKSKYGLKVAEALYVQRLQLTDLPLEILATGRRPGEEDKVLSFLKAKEKANHCD